MARISKYNDNLATHLIKKVWRAALYLRLSREDGDKLESESILSQKLLLNDYLNKKADIQVVDIYSDDGYSGTSFDRPAFLRMFKDIGSGKIDCVIVKDLSRFGRNYVESGKYLEVIFPTLNIRFISVNDNVDSIENPSSLNSVLVPFKNIMNDEYCRDISLKVRSSLTIKRKNGQFIGSFAPYGYLKDPQNKHKLIVDEEAAEVVKKIFKLFTEGYSIAGISRYLSKQGIKNIADYKRSKGLNYKAGGRVNTAGFWSDFMVRRILTSRVYCGDLVQKKTETVSYKVQILRKVPKKEQIIVLNTHQAIITRELFDKTQALLKRDTRAVNNPKDLLNSDKKDLLSSDKVGLFSGFIKCADCLRPMQKKTIYQPYKTYDYYICSTYKKVSKDRCTKHTIRADALENTVLNVIRQQIYLAVDLERVLNGIDSLNIKNNALARLRQEIINAEKEKQKINEIMADLYPDLKKGIILKEQYLILQNRYNSQLLAMDSKLERLNSEIKNQNYGVDNSFIDSLKKHQNITVLTREVVTELIENIFVYENGGIKIDFKFKDFYQDALKFIEKNNPTLKFLNKGY